MFWVAFNINVFGKFRAILQKLGDFLLTGHTDTYLGTKCNSK